MAWYKLECPDDGVYKVENQHVLAIKSIYQPAIKSSDRVKAKKLICFFGGTFSRYEKYPMTIKWNVQHPKNKNQIQQWYYNVD